MYKAPTSGTTQDEVRRRNLGVMLDIVHSSGTTSRSQLTSQTGLNRSTVGALTSELVDAGLVHEFTPAGRGVGRPSILVAPNSRGVYVVAVELGVERSAVALVGLGGAVLYRIDVKHPKSSTPAVLVRRVQAAVEKLRCEVDPRALCVGFGVSVPGLVRRADGLVEVAPNLGWREVPLADLLNLSLGATQGVAIANDADLAAIAEHARGASVGVSHVVQITGDVGIGAGILLDGRLMSGAGGYGGEIGHMVIDPTGAQCRCGSRGCLETFIGEDAVLAALKLPRADNWAQNVVDRPVTRRQLAPVGRWLGIGLANIVNIFNPAVIVLGGHFAPLFALMADVVNEQLASALSAPREQVRIEVARLGGDGVVVGAAEMAFAPLLADPLGHLDRMRAEQVA